MSTIWRQIESRFASVFHILQWLPTYQLASLPNDALAGVTLAAYAIPVSMAYATLAGLPPHYGIYCYLVGGLGYVFFGTSRQLAMGPTSAIAMLVGTTVAGMANGDPARWAAIAALTALVVAALERARLDSAFERVGEFHQRNNSRRLQGGRRAHDRAHATCRNSLAFPAAATTSSSGCATLLGQLGDTNGVVLAFGVVAIALLVMGDRFFPGRPVALFVVATAIAVMSVTNLADRGVAIVGAIPAGLPEFAWPALRPRDVDGILPLAAACFLLAYVEGVSAARTLAEKHGYRIHPRQELLGLSAANFAAAFFHGFPIAGGLSQSAVNDKAGAKSPLSLVFASLAIGGCLLFFTGLLHNLALRRARRDCAGGRARFVRRRGAQAPVARESVRVQCGDGGPGWRAFAGHSPGRIAGRDRVAAHAAGDGSPAACRRARPNSRHRSIFRSGAASRQ